MQGKPELKLVKYVERVWIRFIKNNMLNYIAINQEYRANSVLEAYNARIKKFLPYKPNIALFMEFIMNEEQYFDKEISRKISQGEQQTFKGSNYKTNSRKSSSRTKKAQGSEDKNGDLNLEDESDFYSTDEESDSRTSLLDQDRFFAEEGERMATEKKSALNPNQAENNNPKDAVPQKRSKKRKNDEIISIKPEFNSSKLNSNSIKPPAKQPKRFNNVFGSIPKRILEFNMRNKENSCRYTSFIALYRYKLIYIHSDFNEKSLETNGQWLNKLIDLNENLIGNEYRSIEEFSNYNTLKKYEMDKFGDFGAITPLFTIFRSLDICLLQTEDTKQCSVCTYNVTIKQKVGPLFSFNEARLQGNSIQESLIQILSPIKWYCEQCSTESTDEATREIIFVPRILFIVLDLNYSRLKAYSDYRDKIDILDLKYELCAAITKPAANHFVLLIKDPQENFHSAVHLGWYRYDDQSDNGNIVPLNYDIKIALKKYRGYILVYKRIC